MASKKRTRARRVKGTGSYFWHEGRGVWVGRVPVGRKASGKTAYVERSDPDQAKLVEKMRKAGPPGPETTLAEWADRWLAGLGVRVSTKSNYASNVATHIKPALGHVRVRDLTPYQVEQAARQWSRPAGPLGVNSVRLVLAHLAICLNAAVRAKLTATNPVDAARRPAGKRKEVDPFTPGELAAIIGEAARRATTRPLAVAAATGCRIGEAMALDVADWNPATREIAITKTTGQRKEFGVGPPKSANSVRTIGVPPQLVPVLEASTRGRKAGPLCPNAAGAYPAYQVVRRSWVSLLKRLGLRARNPHQLRHSVATVLIAAGEPIGDVAAFLGDTVETVVRTYLHKTGTKPAETIGRLLSGDSVGAGAGK